MLSSDFTEHDRRRFWAKVQIGHASQCWEWLAGKTPKGYGRFGWHRRALYSHRVAYILEYGTCAENLVVDHLCRNSGCVNPAHLEAVTHEVNISRGDSAQAKVVACPKGHPYTPENTYIQTNRTSGVTRRVCRQCKLARLRRRYDDPEFAARQKAYRAETRAHRKQYEASAEFVARRREREQERLAAMTPEERRADKDAANARARANYLKRKERQLRDAPSGAAV